MKKPASVDLNAPDPYVELGLEPAATPDEIKRTYFTLVRAHPPERDPERFKAIRAAYDRLNTPEKRLATDMLRVQTWPEPALDPVALPELAVRQEDTLRAAAYAGDLGRTDWHEDYGGVAL